MSETIIPDELVGLCGLGLDPNSEEGRLLLPPDEVVTEVNQLAAEGGEPSDFLTSWLGEQNKVYEEGVAVSKALPEMSAESLPGWVGSQWAIYLGARWSAGLADAVREGKAWLAENQ